MNNYIALNGWIYCGFGGEKKPREFIDWAAAKGLDGIELTVGDCLSVETDETEAKAAKPKVVFMGEGNTVDKVTNYEKHGVIA